LQECPDAREKAKSKKISYNFKKKNAKKRQRLIKTLSEHAEFWLVLTMWVVGQN
jgi:hypothetical protein